MIAQEVGCSRYLVYLVKNTGVGSGKQHTRRRKRAQAQEAAAASKTDIGVAISAIEATSEEAARLRSTLERIQAIVREALAQ